MSTKLSKRKQKALAFRGKKPTDSDAVKLDNAFGDADFIPLEQPASSSWLGNDTKLAKSKRKSDNEDKTVRSEKSGKGDKGPPSSKKRKAEDSDGPSKKRKVSTDGAEPSSKRYIIFVGNLPHSPSTILLPALQSHFPAAPTQIRIPTKKGTSAPQGFAFLEFDSAPALEKALRCHHTILLGRKINVELTAGGGGKSETRMGKIKKRNEGLEEERKRRLEEESKEKGKKTEGIHPDRLKRMQGST
jgi:nucleolar protein 6